MKYGYIRVSTAEQNTARQDVLMQTLGVDNIFTDKISGKNMQRPQLKAMLEVLQPGDTVIVESISRFARNTRDLLDLIDELIKKDVTFISKKESVDTDTPQGKFMLTIWGAMAEMERAFILERQAEGIAIKKSQGGYDGANWQGRPRQQVDAELFEEMFRLVSDKKMNYRQAAGALRLSYDATRKRMIEREKHGEAYNPNIFNY